MIEFLKKPEIMFIIFAFILTLILFIANIIRQRRKAITISQLVLVILSFVVVCVPLVFKILDKALPTISFLSFSFEAILALVAGLIAIASSALMFGKTNDSIYKETPNVLNKKIYAYLDKNSNVINYTSSFFDEINMYKKEQNHWYKKASGIFINGEELDYKAFLAKIKDIDGVNFKISLDIDDEEVSFNVSKIAIEKEEEIIGYILVGLDEKDSSELVDGFSLVIDELDLPYAYYNDESKSVIYTINKAFKDLLGIRGRTVTYQELRRLVFFEDLGAFDQASSEVVENNTYCYRMKTSQGIMMFTEIKKVKDDHVTSIITEASVKEENYISRKDLFEQVNKNIASGNEFGGIIISLNSFIEIFNKKGADVAKELVNKFVGFLQREVLSKNDLICKISDIEYLVLFADIEAMDAVVRDVCNGVSILTKYEFNYGDEVITTNNTLGIVYSQEKIKSSEDFMNALDSALAFANSDNYNKDYSIYAYKDKDLSKKETTKKVTKDNATDYSFDKYKINLDNSFLNDEE